MRFWVLSLVLLCCGSCEYETNYYYYTGSDAGVIDAEACDTEVPDTGPVDGSPGDGDEMSDNIFVPGSKLQGNALVSLQVAPPAPTGGQPWPFVYNSNAYQFGVELVNVQMLQNVPRVITISLGMLSPMPTDDTGGGPWEGEVVAIIELGVGGLAYVTEIDFVQGVQFSVSASRLKLTAVYRCLPGSAWRGPFPRPTANVGAAVSLGNIAHGRQPQRTLGKVTSGGPGALTPGAHEHWIVPTFAKSFRTTAVPNNSAMRFDILNLTTNPAEVFNTVAYPTVDFPLPSDARFITATNEAIVNVNDYRMIFELAL